MTQEIQFDNILDEARHIIESRGEMYGPAHENFRDIAAMWSVILGTVITSEQVAPMMIAVKLCRQKHRQHRDNMIDIAGFAAKGQEVIEFEHRYHQESIKASIRNAK